MILVKPSFEIIEIMGEAVYSDRPERNPHELIERAGRICYKTESKATLESAKKFIAARIKDGHHSVLEHSAITVKIICDRGVTHEIVRHRLVAYSQESTRYCNYAKDDEISVIEPFFFDAFESRKKIRLPTVDESYVPGTKLPEGRYCIVLMNSLDVWFLTCLWTQWGYMILIKEFGKSPQQARSVLPNSLKTEIVMTANIREWRHILKLRTSKAAHPQMREIMVPLLAELSRLLPILFDNL